MLVNGLIAFGDINMDVLLLNFLVRYCCRSVIKRITTSYFTSLNCWLAKTLFKVTKMDLIRLVILNLNARIYTYIVILRKSKCTVISYNLWRIYHVDWTHEKEYKIDVHLCEYNWVREKWRYKIPQKWTNEFKYIF